MCLCDVCTSALYECFHVYRWTCILHVEAQSQYRESSSSDSTVPLRWGFHSSLWTWSAHPQDPISLPPQHYNHRPASQSPHFYSFWGAGLWPLLSQGKPFIYWVICLTLFQSFKMYQALFEGPEDGLLWFKYFQSTEVFISLFFISFIKINLDQDSLL